MNRLFNYAAIPSDDFERALQFYSDITDGLIRRNPCVPFPMAYFLDGSGNSVGHLFQLPGFKPSSDGTIAYMELPGDISETLAKVDRAGGTTLLAKTPIAPGKGHWALFLDTEGNRLALRSD